MIVVRDAVEGPFLTELEHEFQNVRWLTTPEKMYAGGARNLGLDAATGDVIALIGDDTIPQSDWLAQIFKFHIDHPETEAAMLGKISWTPALAVDSLHRWLENHAQFDFKNIARHGATWRHFYTSNISFKKSLLGGDERFSSAFEGWGFEDTELGYRLHGRGMLLRFEKKCEVVHDHEQRWEDVLRQTRSARKNAEKFEQLHSELEILPCGRKLRLLRLAIGFSKLIPTQRARWWREWKSAWIGK